MSIGPPAPPGKQFMMGRERSFRPNLSTIFDSLSCSELDCKLRGWIGNSSDKIAIVFQGSRTHRTYPLSRNTNAPTKMRPNCCPYDRQTSSENLAGSDLSRGPQRANNRAQRKLRPKGATLSQPRATPWESKNALEFSGQRPSPKFAR